MSAWGGKGNCCDEQWRNGNIIVAQTKPAHKEVTCVSAKLVVAQANAGGRAALLLSPRRNNLLRNLYCSLHASRF